MPEASTEQRAAKAGEVFSPAVNHGDVPNPGPTPPVYLTNFYPMLRNFVSNDRFYGSIGLKEIFDMKSQAAPTAQERDQSAATARAAMEKTRELLIKAREHFITKEGRAQVERIDAPLQAYISVANQLLGELAGNLAAFFHGRRAQGDDEIGADVADGAPDDPGHGQRC